MKRARHELNAASFHSIYQKEADIGKAVYLWYTVLILIDIVRVLLVRKIAMYPAAQKMFVTQRPHAIWILFFCFGVP